MKAKFLLFLICTILYSCTESNTKYYGKWNLMPEYFSDGELYKLVISKDSISFISGFCFNNKLSYPLKIKHDKFYFRDTIFNVSIENDTLLNFNKTIYINNSVCKDIPFYNDDFNRFVRIDFPKLKNQKKLQVNNNASFIRANASKKDKISQ